MAQIQIVGNINQIDNLLRLNEEDQNVVSLKSIDTDFKPGEDIIEYFILTPTNEVLFSNYNYSSYRSSPEFRLTPSGALDVIEIDPVNDLKLLGYSSGEFKVQYNFIKNRISSFPGNDLFIKEISEDRTELRISSNTLSNLQIETLVNQLISEINNNSEYYKTYLLNFQNNIQYIVINLLLDTVDQYDILLKLYNPLSNDILEKSNLWISDELINPYIFDINLDVIIEGDQLPELRGPNFDIKISNTNTITNEYQSYNNIIDTLKNNSTSSYYQFISFITSQSLNINVDYTDFSEFVNFSSAQARVENFFNKVEDIQDNQVFINTYTPFINTTSSLAKEISIASSSIEEVISGFDGFEHYLYFESNSVAYPKSGSTKPYVSYHYTSSIVTTWYNNTITSASSYDDSNSDYLFNILPQYIQNDSSNDNYITFVNMIGHYFDNIWIYLKSITDLYENDNNLNQGVSKDLVYEALKSLGFKTYNNNEGENVLNYIVGNNSGSVDDFTNLSDAFLNNIPKQDITAEVWKRLYHNISLIYKSKGSSQGIKYVNNIFGITSSILDVKEYGNQNYLTGNNDNIYVVSSSITGSELSPFITLQEQNPSSSFNSSYLVDVSFSPQNQINKVLSSSISTSYSSFNIENILGNPQYDTSSSYFELSSTGSRIMSSSFAYTFDYGGFIRLIQMFDNSLFKTIKDLTPVRNNVLTGVTIKPHQLERIKFKRNTTQFTEQEVLDAEYEGPTISEDKSYYWDKFEGNRQQFYSGEFITASNFIDVNEYFESTNPNIYLFPSSSINENEFMHSEFNTLLNNVSSSLRSINRKKISKEFGEGFESAAVSAMSTYSEYAELQDSYNTLKTHQSSRYEGVKLTSNTYNTFTRRDSSYGKSAVIDKIKYKYGYLVDIYTASLALPNRSNAQIKYLIDNKQNILDLTKANNNIFEVQNIYKSGETINISLFNYDETNPYSNQLANNPTLQIYEGGFRYLPILHNLSGSAVSQSFSLSSPIEISIASGSGASPGDLDITKYSVAITVTGSASSDFPPTYTNAGWEYQINFTGPTLPYRVFVNFYYSLTVNGFEYTYGNATGIVQANQLSSFVNPLATYGTYEGNIYTDFGGTANVTSLNASSGSSTGSITTYLTTTVSSSEPCLYYLTGSNHLVFNNILAQYYSYSPVFISPSDPAWSASGLERVVIPFTLGNGDKVSFYNTASLGWDEKFEYTIKNTYITGSGTGSRLLAELDRNLDGAFYSYTGSADVTTGAIHKSCRYIVLKHVPDETNVILRYNPKDSSIIEDGLLYPQYLDETSKTNSGNVIKILKQQNLI